MVCHYCVLRLISFDLQDLWVVIGHTGTSKYQMGSTISQKISTNLLANSAVSTYLLVPV